MHAKRLFFNLLIIVLISCQNEHIEVIEPSDNEVLKANSAVTNLIKRIATKDGSPDNIIDFSNCIHINLPVTVIANGFEIHIKSEDDYKLIEAVFDKSDDDNDTLKIIFPIEITLSNYLKIKVNNETELRKFTDECKGENEIDDDIECIDFIYPINLSIYDSSNQLAKVVIIENDEQFYKYIETIGNTNIVQINFPIQVILYDGTKKNLANLIDLENIINESKDICDEDDDYDFDDDDCSNCTTDKTIALLLSCSWTVDKIKTNGVDYTDLYSNHEFEFKENGILKVTKNTDTYNGTWEVTRENEMIIVKILTPNLPQFSSNWILYEIEEDNEIDLRNGENRLEFEKTCISKKNEVQNILNDGIWKITYIKESNEIKTNLFTNFKFDFKEDFTVVVTNGTTIINGNWQVIYDSGDLSLKLDFNEVDPFDQIEDTWLIINILMNKIELRNDEDSSSDSILIFEKL